MPSTLNSPLPVPRGPAPRFPRGPLLAIGGLLLTVLIAVALVRLSGVDIRQPDAPAVDSRSLRFEDRPDGSISVIDARSGHTVHTVVGEAGFIRGTLRGMARERKRSGGGPEQAFELVSHADGRLTLSDAVTGRVIDLAAFGPINAAAFAVMLHADAIPSDDTSMPSPAAAKAQRAAADPGPNKP